MFKLSYTPAGNLMRPLDCGDGLKGFVLRLSASPTKRPLVSLTPFAFELIGDRFSSV